MTENNNIMINQPNWKQELEYASKECAWQVVYDIAGTLKNALGNLLHYTIFLYGNHLQDEIDHKKNCVRGK